MKKVFFALTGALALCALSSAAQYNQWHALEGYEYPTAPSKKVTHDHGSSLQNDFHAARPDAHAPISVRGDHYHKKGEWMVSYRYMNMFMKGSRSGADKIGDNVVHGDYMVAPQQMTVNMHMIGAMYAPSDRVTLMAMANYTHKSMDLKTGTGMEFSTGSSGFGDLVVTGLINALNRSKSSIHLNAGVSIPTGSVDQSDYISPMQRASRLAYPMQLGSGTWDPFWGATYLGKSDLLSWGLQSIYRMRTGDNAEGYALGDRFTTSAWGAVKISQYASASAHLNYMYKDRIDGEDNALKDLNPNTMPLFNAENSGKDELSAGIGFNLYMPKGALKNLRLGIEALMPVYQRFNGIQMNNEATIVVGLQYSIGHK